MNIHLNQFLNPFDILFLLTILISFLFGMKSGMLKSLFNLIKWIIIFYLIKNCFNFLRPIFDPFISNQTISDILIFSSTLIVTYLLISFINRLIIGILQPKKSFLIDISFGGIIGILRGYIIFILLIFFININFSTRIIPDFFNNGSFQEIVNYGVEILRQMPRNVDEIQKLNI